MLGAPPLWASATPDSDGTEPADADLMLQVRRGSRDAFERLFTRFRGPVWCFFRRRVPDASRAEELTHDVFLALLQGADRYQGRGPLRAYLFGIAYNILMAERRRAGNRAPEPLESDPETHSPNPDSVLWVRRALAALEPEDREILMLREYEQLSYQELSDVLVLPLNTVRSRLFRARAALRSQLRPETPGRDGVSHGSR